MSVAGAVAGVKRRRRAAGESASTWERHLDELRQGSRLRAKFLGLDLSMASTGVYLGGPDPHAPAGKGLALVPPEGILGQRRLDWIVEALLGFVGERDDVGIVLVEGASFGSGDRAHQKGELHGVVLRELWLRGFWLASIPPASLKVFSCQNGGAKKPEVAVGVFKRWGFEAKTDDEVDAFAASRLAAAVACPTIPGPDAWRRAAAKVVFEPPRGVL